MNVLEVHLLSNQKKFFFSWFRPIIFGIVAPEQQHAVKVTVKFVWQNIMKL
jgi:hypothetical protein